MFTHYACALPDGSAAPTEGIVGFGEGENTYLADRCADGEGLVGAVAKGAPTGTATGWIYTPPPGLPVISVRAIRSVGGAGEGSTITYAMHQSSDICNASTTCPSTEAEASWNETPQGSLRFELACPNDVCDNGLGGLEWQFGGSGKTFDGMMAIKSLTISHEDKRLPVFSRGPSGPLVEPNLPLHDLAKVQFEARDEGSGVSKARLVIDGVEALSQDVGGCVEPFVAAVPCPPSVGPELAFDTTKLPDGLHTVAVEVFDATGVNKATHGPIQVRVENFRPNGQLTSASSLIANGINASRTAKISGIGRSARAVRWQKSRRHSTARGRLVDENGRGIAGAALRVLAATDVPGARAKLLTGVTTDKDGTFGFEIPRGPSRRISVRYRAFADDAKEAAVWRFRVAVPAPIGLIASRARLRNKQKLVLTAHLNGTRVATRSADVAFQVRIGRQWRTFAKRGFSRKGIARVDHRFRVTFHRMTYRFRVVTLRRRNFPFADAHSDPVSVRVN